MEDHPGRITAADRESPALSGRRSTWAGPWSLTIAEEVIHFRKISNV